MSSRALLSSFGLVLFAGSLPCSAAAAPHAALGPTASIVKVEEGERGTAPSPGNRTHRIFMELLIGTGQKEAWEGTVEEGLSPTMLLVRDRLTQIAGNPVPSDVELGFVTVRPSLSQSSSSLISINDGQSYLAAFSYSEDGSQTGTMKVGLIGFDEDSELFHSTVADNVPTIGDPLFNRTAVAVDDEGRSTVAYTNLFGGTTPQILARRVSSAGVVLDPTPLLINGLAADPSAARLDPGGDRVLIVSTDLNSIKGNIVDTTGPTAVVGPDIQISTSAALSLELPSVAADPMTGAFLVVWERETGASGDPVNVRARRFDAAGNPVGDDFLVNTTTANAQAQPAVAFGPNGESVIAWAGDAAQVGDALNIYLQAYDSAGNPIGGELQANGFSPDIQDRPAVRFFAEPDSLGRSQFTVYWRDVQNPDGSGPRGTGKAYALFAIDAAGSPTIFVDGFESGNTNNWSATQTG